MWAVPSSGFHSSIGASTMPPSKLTSSMYLVIAHSLVCGACAPILACHSTDGAVTPFSTSHEAPRRLPRAQALCEPVEQEVEAYLECLDLAVWSVGQVLVTMLCEVRVVVPWDRLHEVRHPLVVEWDGRVGDLPEREPEDEAVEQVVDVIRRLGVEPGSAQRREKLVHVAQPGGSNVTPGQQQLRRPAVAAEGVVNGDRARADRLDLIDVRIRQLPFGQHQIEHSVQEVILVGDVAVERHRLEAELIPESPHRQGVDTRGVGELECRGKDAFPAQRCSRFAGHLTSLRRTL